MEVDVWTAVRDDWPPVVKQSDVITAKSWWKWKFLADDWTEESDNEENTPAKDVPYQVGILYHKFPLLSLVIAE